MPTSGGTLCLLLLSPARSAVLRVLCFPTLLLHFARFRFDSPSAKCTLGEAAVGCGRQWSGEDHGADDAPGRKQTHEPGDRNPPADPVFRRLLRRGRHRPAGRARHVLRLPRAERGRQIDHHQDADRPARAVQRQGPRPRQGRARPARVAGGEAPRRRHPGRPRPVRQPDGPRVPHLRGPNAPDAARGDPRPHRRIAAAPRPGERGEEAGPGILARHEEEAGPRRRPAAQPRPAVPRRAVRGHRRRHLPRHPRPADGFRRPRLHRVPDFAHPGNRREALHACRRHRQGAAGRAVVAGRAAPRRVAGRAVPGSGRRGRGGDAEAQLAGGAAP